MRRLVSIALLLALSATTALLAQPIDEDQGVSGFGLSLRKLGQVGSVLYVTAHPDDENNALLAKLSRGQGLRTGLLTLTRGDGGQNEIGPELFQAIGVLRSEELMAVHRYDRVEQYFTRAYEFGYSFSVEESFQKWGREEILGDLVRVVRTFRPHVMISMNPGGKGGGQHHQASARLAALAFRAAADPNRFSEQILSEGLSPWQPLRLFQSAPRRRPGNEAEETGEFHTIELGDYDPLLGESYVEFGVRARSRHRCQGMNLLPEPRPFRSRYQLADSVVETPASGSDFFQGIETGLPALVAYDRRLSGPLKAIQEQIDLARKHFAESDYAEGVTTVMKGLELVRGARDATSSDEARYFLEREEKDFLEAAARGHFLHFDALVRSSRDGTVVAGEEVEIEVRAINRSQVAFESHRVELLANGWEVAETEATGTSTRFKVVVPADAPYSQPYWKLFDPRVDRYTVQEGYTGMEPFPSPPLTARLHYVSAGVAASLDAPVQRRWYDPEAATERRMEVKVVPRLALSVSPGVGLITATPGRQEIRVQVRHNSSQPTGAALRLSVPAGWTVSPEKRDIRLESENQAATLGFTVSAPSETPAGSYEIQAQAESEGRVFKEGYQVISYHHIQTRHLYHPATARIQVVDAALPPDLEVGYVEGVGDEVAAATAELGASVTLLESDDLASGDLSRFDVIVTGVRAYLNPHLVSNNHRLLEYVERGGHLVVQWNKYEFMRGRFAPYPLKINRPADRVSVEESPVAILQPAHPIFTSPNPIRASDWEGWVQERATYMWGEWDERYQPLIEMQDPWPYNSGAKRGGLLLARYGQGTYFFAGLAFFRQLPAGVPGAYRLWANILALGRVEESP